MIYHNIYCFTIDLHWLL